MGATDEGRRSKFSKFESLPEQRREAIVSAAVETF